MNSKTSINKIRKNKADEITSFLKKSLEDNGGNIIFSRGELAS